MPAGKSIPVIIDCDPGKDDVIALFMALSASEQLDILGVTTVAGNVPLDLTTRNALMVCEYVSRKDVAVYQGCDRPLQQPLKTAEWVHGKSGVEGFEVFEPTLRLQQQHAVDFIIDSIQTYPANDITLVATGPLTNIATAFNREPAIIKKLRQIIIMGGARTEGGNISASAEFNMTVDPDAADIVFNSGCSIILMGLDVTHRVIADKNRRSAIASIPNKVAQTTVSLLEFYAKAEPQRFGGDGAPVHDPCTIAYLLSPNLFTTKPCHVAVETESELTLGHTAVDYWGASGKEANVQWVDSINADGFFNLLCASLEQYNGIDA